LIAEAWSFNWSIWSFSLGAEGFIVNHFQLVDVLAWIAIPKGVLTILLPPFTVKTGKGSFWINLWFWAGVFDWGKLNAVVVHSASEEFISGIVFIGKGALGCAVLVMKLHWSSIIVIEWVASILAPGLLHESWVNHSFGHFHGTVLKGTFHVNRVWILHKWVDSVCLWYTSLDSHDNEHDAQDEDFSIKHKNGDNY
jgi:uncharacterized membrane protein YqaE (UPF0057 family)